MKATIRRATIETCEYEFPDDITRDPEKLAIWCEATNFNAPEYTGEDWTQTARTWAVLIHEAANAR